MQECSSIHTESQSLLLLCVLRLLSSGSVVMRVGISVTSIASSIWVVGTVAITMAISGTIAVSGTIGSRVVSVGMTITVCAIGGVGSMSNWCCVGSMSNWCCGYWDCSSCNWYSSSMVGSIESEFLLAFTIGG